jgi:Fe-S-cluster-containing dehydrogenase component
MSTKKRLGIVIDQERCIGCEACSVACKLENKASDYWIKVETQGSNVKDTPTGTFPSVELKFLPKLCNHCKHPPCVDSCSVDALVKRDDGVVVLNQDLCTLCKNCLDACPYNIIVLNEKENIAEKCNLCSHRIDQGLEPFCVICCEGQAMHFGDFNDPNSVVTKIISEKDTFRLKIEEGTNPSVYYCPPRPKKRL